MISTKPLPYERSQIFFIDDLIFITSSMHICIRRRISVNTIMSVIFEGHDILIYSTEPFRRNAFYQSVPTSTIIVVDKNNWLKLSDGSNPVSYANINCLLFDLEKRASDSSVNMFVISNVYSNVKRVANPPMIPMMFGKNMLSSCSGASFGNSPGPVF